MGLIQSRIEEIENKLNTRASNNNSSQPKPVSNTKVVQGKAQVQSQNTISSHNPNYQNQINYEKSQSIINQNKLNPQEEHQFQAYDNNGQPQKWYGYQ